MAAPDPARYFSENYVVLDFETTTFKKGLAVYKENSAVLTCWRLGPGHPDHAYGEVGSTRGNEYQQQKLVDLCLKADFLVMHNAKFDLQWLDRCGLDLSKVLVWDTMIAEYVIGGNRWVWAALSLANCTKRRGWGGKMDVIGMMYKAGLCSLDVPASWLLRYCHLDVDLTWRLFEDQLAHMRDTRLLAVTYTRCLATPVLADIEKNGMMLDSGLVKQMTVEREAEYARVMYELERETAGINVNSTLQLREYLYVTLEFDERKDRKGNHIRTATGLPKTDAETIALLRPKTVGQRNFLYLYKKSKELHNELTKYLRKFADCGDEVGGLLIAQFNQTNTRTHRLSSSGLDYNAQFQNFPRSYKPLFRSRFEDWLVGEADGAQLEFRAAAHLGRDEVALRDIQDGIDVHSVTAGIIGCTRQEAKPHTFKPLYGGRSGSPNEVRYYEFFRDKYRGVTATQQSWINAVLCDKKLETEWGMIFYWPDTKMENGGYVKNSTSICNYPVQSFATAEIIPVGLVYMWHYLKVSDLKMFITNTVHDSVIVELPPEEKEVFGELSYKAMVEDTYAYLEKVYNVRLTVPLAAGVSVGPRWGDKESKASETLHTATEDLYGAAA